MSRGLAGIECAATLHHRGVGDWKFQVGVKSDETVEMRDDREFAIYVAFLALAGMLQDTEFDIKGLCRDIADGSACIPETIELS